MTNPTWLAHSVHAGCVVTPSKSRNSKSRSSGILCAACQARPSRLTHGQRLAAGKRKKNQQPATCRACHTSWARLRQPSGCAALPEHKQPCCQAPTRRLSCCSQAFSGATQRSSTCRAVSRPMHLTSSHGGTQSKPQGVQPRCAWQNPICMMAAATLPFRQSLHHAAHRVVIL